MEKRSLYEEVLRSLDGGSPVPPPKPPRPSAAVVLWRHSHGELEVYWVKRNPDLGFMGGWHSFPGGALSRSDVAVPVAGRPAGGDEAPTATMLPETLTDDLDDVEPNLVDGLVAAALRELLEETGVVPTPELAAADHGRLTAADVAARLATARHAVLELGRPFAEVLDELDLTLDASRLVFAGRWLTPPFAARRFDNRFFLLEWPSDLPAQPLVAPGELESGEWIDPAEAYLAWRRGRVMAAPPVLHLLKVLAQNGPSGAGLERMREPAEANLGPYRRIEFLPGIVMLPLPTATLPPADRTNLYLLGHGERVLVDPGPSRPQEIERLIGLVEACAAEGRPVRAIWLTHHHADHVGAVAPLAERFDLPVAAHPETAARLAARGIRVDRELHDSERLVLDGDPEMTWRVLHTPGHAPGHLAFLDEESGALVVGDMVSALSTIVIDPPDGNMQDYLDSLRRLAELEPRHLLPGHGPLMSSAVARLEELIAHRHWREERVLRAWQSGLRDPAEIRPEVYDDIPPPAVPLAERQIVAHLDRLRSHGRIR